MRDSIRFFVPGRSGLVDFRATAAEELPDVVPIMDLFHVVRLSGDALDVCRRRVQQTSSAGRGMKGDPLYRREPHRIAGQRALELLDRFGVYVPANRPWLPSTTVAFMGCGRRRR